MGAPGRVIAQYERAAWVQPLPEGGVDEYYRPVSVPATAQEIMLTIVEDPAALQRVDPGLVQSGSLLAYVREEHSQHVHPKARVWWDDANNSSGVKYEVQRIEDYRSGFGRLGGFMRLTLARVEV